MDVAIYRPSSLVSAAFSASGTWWLLLSGSGYTTYRSLSLDWGASQIGYNIPVVGDIDGDRKADVIESFSWWVVGIPGDTPVPNIGTPTATQTTTISIVGINGSQSFSPSPAQLSSSALVKWHNNDTLTHRILLDDGSFDSRDLPPGSDSGAILAVGATYHCLIHPSMVGTIALPP